MKFIPRFEKSSLLSPVPGMAFSRSGICFTLATAAVFTLLTGGSARATGYTWTGTTSTAWGTATNWTPAGGPPVSATADSASFGSSTLHTATVDLGGNQSVGSVNMVALETGTTLIEGGGTNSILTLGNNGIQITAGAGAVTIGGLTATNQAVNLSFTKSQNVFNGSSNLLTMSNDITNVGTTTGGAVVTLSFNGTGSGGYLIGGAISDGAIQQTSINLNSGGAATTLAGHQYLHRGNPGRTQPQSHRHPRFRWRHGHHQRGCVQ